MEDTSHLYIEFFSSPEEDKNATREQGRPIFVEKEFVRIKWVGDRLKELVAPADDHCGWARDSLGSDQREKTYKEEFPRHYEAFKKNQDVAGSGTPLSELPFLTNSKRAELKALNIHTAESLAQLDGTPLQRLGMGGRELKNQAQAYLDKARDGAVDAKLAAQNARLEDELAKMRAQMQELLSRQAQPMGPVIGSEGQVARPAQIDEHDELAAGAFIDWPDDELRNYIRTKTGAAVRGQPSHETLVKMAADVAESEAV